MPEPEETPPPEETPEETPPPDESIVIEEHIEPSIVTWTQEEKDKIFTQLSQIGEFLNGQKKEEPKPTEPATLPPAEPKRKRGLRYKRK